SPHLEKKNQNSLPLDVSLSDSPTLLLILSSDQNPHGFHRTTRESSSPTTTRVKSPG
ncbi:unnamed protein product, partial [Brassica oleracea]